MEKQTQVQAETLARDIADALAAWANSHLPDVDRVSRNSWSNKAYTIAVFDKDQSQIATASIKVSDVWIRTKGFFPTVFVSVSGGYISRSQANRTKTYRMASVDKLDTVKARMLEVALNTRQAGEVARGIKAAEVKERRSQAEVLKAAGWTAKSRWSDADLEAEADNDWLYSVDLRGEKNGMTIGLPTGGGEIRVRLPETMTLEDFLKKLG